MGTQASIKVATAAHFSVGSGLLHASSDPGVDAYFPDARTPERPSRTRHLDGCNLPVAHDFPPPNPGGIDFVRLCKSGRMDRVMVPR